MNLSTTIGDAYQALCQRAITDSGIDVVLINGIRFIGFDIERKALICLAEARKALLEPFSAYKGTRIVQVIGDSGYPISADKLSWIYELLDRYITDHTVVEYGFTRSERDANWVVESVATQNPTLTPRIVGNIVQVSADSIKSAGWSAFPKIEHLAFVYRRSNPPTTFGDDVWLSDGVMTTETGDTMICLEGGPQALRQCVNVLLVGVKVIAVTKVREDEAIKRFSAAGLLAHIMLQGLSEESSGKYLAEHPPRNNEQCQTIIADLRQLSQAGLQTADLLIEIRTP